MPRGRRAQSLAVKAIKGNPGKRRLALQEASAGNTGGTVLPQLEKLSVQMPSFLTAGREQEIFRRVMEDHLQRRIARPVDATAYGRWATYVHQWLRCKEELDGEATYVKSESKHGTMLRRHPLFKDMIDLEKLLQSLEDRLGLNPTARQNIIRGLAAVPPALGGLVIDDDTPQRQEPYQEQPSPLADAGPLGYLQAAGKLN